MEGGCLKFRPQLIDLKSDSLSETSGGTAVDAHCTEQVGTATPSLTAALSQHYSTRQELRLLVVPVD